MRPGTSPETGEARPAERIRWTAPIVAWAGICVFMVVLFWPAIAGGLYADVDDSLRLQQVRDWLAGQGWFDLNQYRIGPVGGALSMHWSRLVDLPLAAFMAPLVPLLGRTLGEAIAVTAVPLLTLGVTIAAMAVTVRRLLPDSVESATLAAVLLAASSPIVMQIHPTRIDHHGWQIACAALALAAVTGPRPTRAGLLAGLAAATQLVISLEGLPWAAALGAVLALGWATGREGPRRLVAFATALAGGALVLLAVTAPVSRFGIPWCDALLPGHVAALSVAAGGLWLARGRRGRAARVGALLATGLAAGGTLALAAPACLAGPFATLDPISARLWYGNVVEGLPIWRQTADAWPVLLGFPLVGLFGAWRAWRAADGREERRRWSTVLLLGIATLATGLLVRRAAGIAHLVAIPGALALVAPWRARLAGRPSLLMRVFGGTLAILAFSPLPWLIPAVMLVPPDEGDKLVASPPTGCNWKCALDHMPALPPATMLTGVDIGPRLVTETPHRAFTSGYHRSGRPMSQTLTAFTSSPEVAHRIILANRLDYVLVAPFSGEVTVDRAVAPHGFAARLADGDVPAWLAPVPLRGRELRLYRVRRLP